MPLDIGLGILAAIAIARTTALNLSSSLLILAIIFVLLPDLDFLLHFVKREANEFSHEHRDLFHYPLLYIPIGFVIIAFININFAYLFFLCSVVHFLHDSMGMGWGVRWLSPFSRKYYKFFSDKNGKMSSNFLVVWTPQEQREVAAKYGDPRWIANYFNFSRELIIELLVFVVAILSLFYVWFVK